MLTKHLFVGLAATGLSLGTPLEPRASLSSVALEKGLLEYQVDYQHISDLITNYASTAANDTVAYYGAFVKGQTFLDKKKGKAFGKAVQFALCNAETTVNAQHNPNVSDVTSRSARTDPSETVLISGVNLQAVLELLEAQSDIRLNIAKFTPEQKQKMAKIVGGDKAIDKEFAPAMQTYVPVCARQIAKNGKLTQASYAYTIELLQSDSG